MDRTDPVAGRPWTVALAAARSRLRRTLRGAASPPPQVEELGWTIPHDRTISEDRICIVGSGWRFLSGISYYTCQLSNAVSERHDTFAILMRRLLPRRAYPGSSRVGADLSRLRYRDTVDCYDGVDYYWIPSIIGAVRFLRARRPTVLVLQWWTGTVLHSYLLLAAVARRGGARVIIEFHEILDTGEAANPLVRAYVSRLIQPLMRMTDGFIVHSTVDREALRAKYGLGDKPLVVSPHGPFTYLTSSSGVRDGSAAERRPSDCCRLLFFGTIRPYKGLEHLVEAFDGLTDEEVARFHLTVVGETWEGWDLPIRMIATARHRERITLINHYVTDDEVARHFAETDAVVLPYLRSSASGPLQLAMSQGLPVAVTKVGGLVEAASDYEGIRFVQPGDIADLRQALLELPAMTGQTYADPHSWDRSVERLEELLAAIRKGVDNETAEAKPVAGTTIGAVAVPGGMPRALRGSARG
jgi:glycosyltransferase involved in cell wall biosynthesis